MTNAGFQALLDYSSDASVVGRVGVVVAANALQTVASNVFYGRRPPRSRGGLGNFGDQGHVFVKRPSFYKLAK